LYKDIPKIRISLIAHGDYCDAKRIISKIDFHNKSGQEELVKFVREVPMTFGGDYPEAYEYGMHFYLSSRWNISFAMYKT
jgi:hypothetical protein